MDRGEGIKVQAEIDQETHDLIVEEKRRRREANENATVERLVKEAIEAKYSAG